MVKCKDNNKDEKSAVQTPELISRNAEGDFLQFDARDSKKSGLIAYILRNPAAFVAQPGTAADLFGDSDFAAAHAYFSEPKLEKYVFSVCTALFRQRYHDVGLRLYASGLTESRQCRFWPFWFAKDLNPDEAKSPDKIENYLLELWNSPKGPRWTPGMFYQTGFLEIEDFQKIGELFFYKCGLPIRRSVGRKPDSITFVFDTDTRSFYTINSRVRWEEPEHRFRFVEFIDPKLTPPDLRKFTAMELARKWKILFVLDRHIGDNLSLFSTHLSYLSRFEQFDITVDSSMCLIFHKAPREIVNRFFHGAGIKFLETLPANKADYDLVFDPYDWTSNMFDLKPQNDSCAVSIVSGLEYGRCCLNRQRRDILDIHMNSLKRMGFASPDEPTPEFVRYRINKEERVSIREKTRARLLRISAQKKSAKIVSIFPYGLTEDRRYPTEALQSVMNSLLRDPNIHVLIAGNQYDTSEMALTLRTDWMDQRQPLESRIRMFSEEPLASLIDIMLASDVVVSMDSGPLHLARALRIQPIGLYTGKVNKEELLTHFPWLVEDGTAETLKPNVGDEHVNPAHLISAILKKLNFLPLD
jgi:ADP-heptose:LPS heptosyltransferase